MTGLTVIVAISAAGVVFLIYVFAALCKESRRGVCHVVQILWHQEQDELEMPSMGTGEVIPIDARSREQHPFDVGERRAIRVGR